MVIKGSIPQLKKSLKLVLTGGPGGGKTTALDLFRREFPHRISVVPEAATILFQGGIQRCQEEEVRAITQLTIWGLQKNIEKIQSKLYPDCLILCDRGSLDGLAYWPKSDDDFFLNINSTLEDELAEYDAVIFFETAAASNKSIESNNPNRIESEKQAVALDKKLQLIWSQHKNYFFVGSEKSFLKKIQSGIKMISKAIEQHPRDRTR